MGALDNYFEEAAANPCNWLVMRDEFTETLNTGRWETVKDAGAAAAVGADTANGALVLTSTATTDNDGALVQSINEFVLPTSGKRILFACKVKDSDADQTDLFAGLAQTAATDPEATLAVSNRVGFQIDDGNASILAKSEASDVETSKDTESDLADNTYSLLEFYYDGEGQVNFYVDGSLKTTITTNIPATELGVAMFHLSGSNSGTRTSTWDFVHVAVEL